MSGVGKDAVGISGGKDTTPSASATTADPSSLTETKNQENSSSKPETGTNFAHMSAPLQEPGTMARSTSFDCRSNEDHAGENCKISSAAPLLIHCNSSDAATSNPDEPQAAERPAC